MTISEARVADQRRVLLWHEQVHKYFGQQLLYYFIGIRPFSQVFLDEFAENLRNTFGNSGFCANLLFGPWDILLRIWLRPKLFPELSSFLTQYQGIFSLALFQVDEIATYWASKDKLTLSKKQITETLNRCGGLNCIKSVQDGENPTLKSNLKKDGLLIWDASTFHKGDIKFFICVSPEPDVPKDVEANLRKNLKNILLTNTQIERPSLYFGRGIAWALVKGLVKRANHGSLANLVLDLSNYVNQFGMRTMTSIILEPGALEFDSISDETLSSLTMVTSPELEDFLPELVQSTKLTDVEKVQVAEYILENRFFRNLSEQDREFMRQILRYVAIKDNGGAWGHLFFWCVKQEKKLGDKWNDVLRSLTNENAEQVRGELYTRHSVPKDKQFVTIGHYIELYADLCKEYLGDQWNLQTDKEFRELGNILTRYRNRLAHGSLLEPLDEWKKLS